MKQREDGAREREGAFSITTKEQERRRRDRKTKMSTGLLFDGAPTHLPGRRHQRMQIRLDRFFCLENVRRLVGDVQRLLGSISVHVCMKVCVFAGGGEFKKMS